MARRRRPKKIGPYEVEKVLGEGGMGAVYLCRDPYIDRRVAVKVLPRQSRGAPSRSMRFLREAITTARLQHPGIPPVHSIHEGDKGQIYYVMKPIEGRSLEEILDGLREGKRKIRNNFDLHRLVEVLRDVAQTVHYAHSQGYIHRDLKPSNIFVGDYGEVYVIDWGLTKELRGDEEKREHEALAKPDLSALELKGNDATQTFNLLRSGDTAEPDGGLDVRATLTLQGDILGTLAYMAPEQAAGQSDIGPEADVYALGVILYEILTGDLPLRAAALDAFIECKLAGAIEPPELRVPTRTVPPELSHAALQAMTADRTDRTATAEEFERALTHWIEGKTPLRNGTPQSLSVSDFRCLPRAAKKGWEITKDSIATRDASRAADSALVFTREFFGDTRFFLNFLVLPDPETGTLPGLRLFINATLPARWKGMLEEGYEVHLGANDNTRAVLLRNNAEVLANDYILLEPYRNYRLQFERADSDLRVFLDRQLILYHRDRNITSGFCAGFIHDGPGVTYRNIRVQTRGLPATISTLDLPESLMAEGCYAAAQKHFFAYAQSHRNRHEGAWARYRAALATYHLDENRTRAFRILRPLRKSHFTCLEYLGRSRIEWEAGRHLKAAQVLQRMLDEVETLTHVHAISDVAFSAVQQVLRRGGRGKRVWRTTDAWCRVALTLARRDESQRSMVPSVLWRWLMLALAEHPDDLADCMAFLREGFGTGQGVFAELMTGMEPLMNLLRRTRDMQEHRFLVDRVMRLILKFDDNLGNLETLARFYLHAGHEDVATRIYRHIHRLCQEHGYRIPPTVGVWLGVTDWLRGNRDRARTLFQETIDQGAEYGPDDGRLLLGLDHHARGEEEEARERWEVVRDDRNATTFNRHLVAQGLLGELPPDPVDAGVPNRSDHRLLYCLLLAYKDYATWERSRETGAEDEAARDQATALLLQARDRIRPSYDIYSATDTFERLPLEELGHPLPPAAEPDPLSQAEEDWVRQLAVAAAHEESEERRRTTSSGRRRTSGPAGRRSRKRRK